MIELKNLSKSFGDRKVLNGISLKIQAGEIVFIIGTSGTGKSVLLKNMVGLLRADEGEIWIDGQEVSKISEVDFFEVRRKCGMVFQQPALFDSVNVFENVAFGLKRLEKLEGQELHDRVQEALRAVHVHDVAEKYPAEISYGTQKRVSLARSLALKPKILLFDEPTTGLDPVATTTINDLIGALSRKSKTTSVIVSHDMQCALNIADRIVVLDQGKVLIDGSPSDLRASQIPLVRDFLAEVHT